MENGHKSNGVGGVHKKRGLLERLEEGKPLVLAEGYVVELQRRGYCKGHLYIPEIILDAPHVISNLHEEFAHSGSDILVACLYYVNRKKLEMVNAVDKFEAMNRKGLEVCREMALRTNTLFAGNLCNSIDYAPADPESVKMVREMFKEQVLWAVEAGVDLFINETFRELGEALLSLEVCKEYAPGVPCIVMLAPYGEDRTQDGYTYPDAMLQLRQAGAHVVGLNCARGPETMLPLLEDIRKVYQGPLACNPLPFRTSKEEPTWLQLRDWKTGNYVHPDNNDLCLNSTDEIVQWAKDCKRLNIQVVGLCCGNSAKLTRALAHGLDRSTPADSFDTPTHVSFSLFAQERQLLGVSQK